MQSRQRLVTLLAIFATLVLAGPATWATDTPIPGRVLLIKDGKRLKMVAKPVPTGTTFPIPTPGGSSDPTLAGGLVSVVDEGDNTHTFYGELPAAQWRALGNPAGSKGYKFVGAQPSPCVQAQPNPCVRVGVVKGKVIKFVATNDQFLDPPLAGAAMARVEVGPTAYTGHFSGPVLNTAGTYKSTQAPVCTPAPGCCGGNAFHSFTTAAAPGDCGDLVDSMGIPMNLACQALHLGGGNNAYGPGTFPASGQSITAITSCIGQAATLSATTSAQTGSNRTCTGPGCLFGAPVALPNPLNTPTSTCLVSSVNGMVGGSLDCATGDESLSLALAAVVFLTGDTATDPGGTIAGIQPCPLCSGGTCIGGPNNGLACGASDGATSQDCPPAPGYSVDTLPIGLTLTSGTVSWTGTVATNDTGSTQSVQSRTFSGYCRDVVGGLGDFESPAHKCWENGMAVGAACSGTYESCEQRSTGAFGPNGAFVQTITAIGRPQLEIGCGASTGTLVGVFSIPPSFSSADAAFDVPGPGAITMPGAGILCAAANPCPVATNTTTTSMPSTTSTSTSSTTSTTSGGPCCAGDGFFAFGGVVGTGDCGDVQVTNGMILSNLACSGLYMGGGGNSFPLPQIYPDFLQPVFAITSCVGQSATLGPTTSTETGSARNCTSPGCLFGPPISYPNPASTPTSLCLTNSLAAASTGTLNCSTGSTNVAIPLNMIVHLTGDTATDPGGTTVGIQPCPLCLSSTCRGGPNNGMACVPGTSALDAGYPTSRDCPPDGGLVVGTLPIAFALSTGTISWTGTVATNAAGSTASVQTRTFAGYCRNANEAGGFFQSPPQLCWLNGTAVGPACTEPFESCEQQSDGAFGPNGTDVKTITITGTPAGSLLGGPAATTLAGLFAVPPTYSLTLDATTGLPGPGAVSVPGTATLCASLPCP